MLINEVQELKEIIEVAIHISSGLDIDKIVQGVAWFLHSKYNPDTISIILPMDMDDTRPDLYHFKGKEKIQHGLKFDSIMPLVDFFNTVEYNQLTFENFIESFKNKKISNNLVALKPCFLMPLRSDKGIVGIFILGEKNDKTCYDTEEIQNIIYLIRFASIALENANLYRSATVDRMSKLYNHHQFQKRLEEEIVRCQRYNNFFSIIMLDIDNFKQFNDKFGHLQGDIIIKEIANIINTSVRNIDFPARYGGEEFAIVLPQIKGPGAFAVAERLRKIVSKRQFTGGKDDTLHVTISLGVAEFDKNYVQNNSQIISCADKALYISKNKGKNRVTLGCFNIEDINE